MKWPTIYALSSGVGRSALAVIRISGGGAISTLKRLTRKDVPKIRRASRREIYDTHTNELLDSAVAIAYQAPHSFTGEDLVELHVHGGGAVTRAVLQAIGETPQDGAGIRYAEPGEFTLRAFQNDKLDLAEAEGIADLIDAETEQQRRNAIKIASGDLSRSYEGWRQKLLECRALLEAIIDFSEDDSLEDDIYGNVRETVASLQVSIEKHLEKAVRGELLRHGIPIVLVGAPNAGKSSLMNKIAQRAASIVSDEPGTTRDVIEVMLDIGGYPALLGDTAGLREGQGNVEKEGIRRAEARIQRSEIGIVMIAMQPGGNFAIDKKIVESYNALDGKERLVVVNKVDLATDEQRRKAIDQIADALRCQKQYILEISCLSDQGIETVLTSLQTSIQTIGDVSMEGGVASSERHRRYLEECLQHIHAFLAAGENDIVLAAEEIKHAAISIGKLTGRDINSEEILGVIFGKFCIGK